MRIAIDIDSTLHHYWDRLSAAALRRFGVDLPYEEQLDWGITRLRHDQLHLCIQETHCEAAILAGEPYPDAVETVRRWHDDGHFIHVTSHRDPRPATPRRAGWSRSACPSTTCTARTTRSAAASSSSIDLLIDDSPENIPRAIDHGILVATIAHPWNREVCEEEDVICAADWRGLAAKLDPLLRRRARVRP